MICNRRRSGASELASPPTEARRRGALARPGRQLVVRLNRLFWSAGQGGIETFRQQVGRYACAGFELGESMPVG